MKRVLVVLPVQERHKEKLEKAGEGCIFTYSPVKEVTEDMIAEAEIIIGNAPAAKIGASDRLELLQLNSAGADQYIKPGILSDKTILTNATGAYSKAVAEHMFAMMFMLQKKLHLYRDAQAKAQWTDEGTVCSITDATVLVVGLGDIGLHFARMAKALGAYTIGVKRRISECPEGVDELYTTDQLDEVLPRADVIVSFLPGTKATYHIYTKERFALMKKNALFLNGGRGNAVDADVLYEVLGGHQIAAAGIDVTEPEPLPSEHPLWSLANVMITPHISGQYHLPETFERVVDISAENLSAYLNDRPLRNIVDFTTGYKK
ncbi:D-2-hydroxyacid dehydrogenase [Bariatricus sp. SGI.154]|uniref:D-2-hydroxyacid dehydrogenase n=1 Tax=Bariatricus sp. SGI.154 TaxID=3420549 RepID=UPI003D065232